MGARRPGDALIITALAHGKTQREAAELAAVSERTVRRRLEDPAFRDQVTNARNELVANTSAQLAGLFPKAIEAIEACLDDHHGHVRIRAAQVVLTMGTEFRDRIELEARVQEIEDATAVRTRPSQQTRKPATSGH